MERLTRGLEVKLLLEQRLARDRAPIGIPSPNWRLKSPSPHIPLLTGQPLHSGVGIPSTGLVGYQMIISLYRIDILNRLFSTSVVSCGCTALLFVPWTHIATVGVSG